MRSLHLSRSSQQIRAIVQDLFTPKLERGGNLRSELGTPGLSKFSSPKVGTIDLGLDLRWSTSGLVQCEAPLGVKPVMIRNSPLSAPSTSLKFKQQSLLRTCERTVQIIHEISIHIPYKTRLHRIHDQTRNFPQRVKSYRFSRTAEINAKSISYSTNIH